MKRLGISSIVGEPLSGVAFVQDYVEFHFDGKILRALSNPLLASGGGSWAFPEQGSRDALCSMIGRVVVRVTIDEGSRIEVVFSNGSSLVIPLEASALVGPEAAHFVSAEDQLIDVW